MQMLSLYLLKWLLKAVFWLSAMVLAVIGRCFTAPEWCDAAPDRPLHQVVTEDRPDLEAPVFE
jgi:hypothetical protein